MLLEHGIEYFNPDDATRRVLSANPGISEANANSTAWNQGKTLLERAISRKLDFAFETTLGGKTITGLLERAALTGMELRIWYVGLSSVATHLKRVRARVASGGHNIPEEIIRERYTHSRLNLIHLLPHLTELLVYDNSEEAEPKAGLMPTPKLILSVMRGRQPVVTPLTEVPEWAKPIVVAMLKLKS